MSSAQTFAELSQLSAVTERELLLDMPVQVTLQLTLPPRTAREVLQLQPGAELTVEPTPEGVEIWVEGKVWARGEWVQHAGGWRVRLTALAR